nr:di-heme oxidoredictase family protein [uncultured Glaciecola sp.]
MKSNLVFTAVAILCLSACGGGSDSSTPLPVPEAPPIVQDSDNDSDGVIDSTDSCPNSAAGDVVDSTGCKVEDTTQVSVDVLFDENTLLQPMSRFVRDDGVLVTRIGDRGRDRHAKDITIQDHYDHYLAHYWEYRTVRIQLEDYVPTGQSLIRATFITEAKLGAREFRVWFWGRNTTGQFHFNPQKEEAKVSQNETGVVFVGQGTYNDNFEKISDDGIQHKYTLDIVNKWEAGGQFQTALAQGTNMEFEISLFLLSPPAGARLNYYGTSFVYVIGELGVAPFEWQRGVENNGGANDGTPIPSQGMLGGDTTLGFNYSEEPAGRFMQMATNLSSQNAQSFVEGRRVHHTNFDDGSHDERNDNPVWTEQVGKIGNHYINHSCAGCHVRNGKALVEDVGGSLDKWVFKIGDENGDADSLIGKVLQPKMESNGTPEGSVTLGPWTEHANGLRSPNYVFSERTPAQFSARIAPQLIGLGLLEAIPEEQILSWVDSDDANNDGISGRASIVEDPTNGVQRLGRFGYKASTFSVKHQSASAFNTDMGVMTSMLPNPDCGSEQQDCGTAEVELSDQELDKLVKYLSLLGVGARRDYDEQSGETLFADAGCASCHRPSMTTSAFHPLAELRNQTIQPYTDLLLHDMGPGLADTLAEGSASGAEWRTAALWGLGHAQNVMLGDAKANDAVSLAGRRDDDTRIGYLHDGRARTIEEAILWHGGEGEVSKQAFEAMTAENQRALLTFLKSL